jgi:hypothetical protein
MFCIKCGIQLPDGSQFCNSCGTKQSEYKSSYLISINNQQSGPYNMEQLRSMIQRKQITEDYWISQEGSNNWVEIDKIPELESLFDDDIDDDIKSRHGFTSFWLWLCIIANVIGGFSIIFINEEINFFSIMCIAVAITIYLIVRWKKFGFYGFCIAQIVTIFTDDLGMGFEVQLVTCLIQLIIIWAVLQLRNAYGVSAWKQLE